MDAKTNGTRLAVVVDLILVSIVGFCLSSTTSLRDFLNVQIWSWVP